ncbi:MAG: hypothetical protein QW607_11720 [Desulfurococcaceae archaeon]
MPEEFSLSLKEVIETLLEYAKGKGQIPDLPRFFILCNLSTILEKKYGLKINWKTLVEQWSINAPPYREPLWLHVIRYLSNLNTRTEIITQVSKRKLLEK